MYIDASLFRLQPANNRANPHSLLSACARSAGAKAAQLNPFSLSRVLRNYILLQLFVLSGIAGCSHIHLGNPWAPAPMAGAHLAAVDFSDASSPTPSDQPIALHAAKNEWVSFTITVTGASLSGDGPRPRLRLSAPEQSTTHSTIGPDNLRVYQVLSMPIDVNRAGYVRQTGLPTSTRMLPRALFPLPMNNGIVDLSALRPSAGPPSAPHAAGAAAPPLIWVDVRVPAEAAAGDYAASCDLLPPDNDQPVASLPVQLSVSDFVLPAERHLMMVGQVGWDDLKRLYPDRFETLRPFLLTRGDSRCADAVKTLDQLQQLAEANRCQVLFAGLQPTVKWPAGLPPVVLWDDYDAFLRPWLGGGGFADKTPLGFWPLPVPEHLFNYDPQSRRDYWAAAAAHFDQNDWLMRSGVVLEAAPGRADTLAAVKISADAAEVLGINQRLRVIVPLEDDQVQFASDQAPNLVQPQTAMRLITASPGLVFSSPIARWPADVPHGPRWLRNDLRGLMTYVGAGGNEGDVRVWSWLADIPLPPPRTGEQYGPVQFVSWPGSLPRNTTPHDPGDPDELVWFYPGSWFGIDEPVATVQLKWLRRAQQDYEYLFLCRERGDAVNPLLMARLLTKPVELSPDQRPDPLYGLMSGTTDPAAWSQAMLLLAQRILLHEPGTAVDKKKEMDLDLAMLRWIEPQERPLLLGRTTQWVVQPGRGVANAPAIGLHLGIDIYNASDRTPDENDLAWSDGPAGWHWQPQPIPVPQLATYHVRRFVADATIEPTELAPQDRKPVVLTFTDGFTKQEQALKLLAPAAISRRLEGKLTIDGNLNDWSSDDAIILDAPLVQMFDRPTLQAQQMKMAATSSQIFTGWADENFYLAFKVSGISSDDVRQTKNWVAYDEFGRAWGEDLCQVLIQPIYVDGTSGAMLHVVLKPNGNWVERKQDPRHYADPWPSFEGAGVRYAATLDDPDWRGELAIPWTAIGDTAKGRPIALRFNFSQHKVLTGESSSWAGPVDFGRDGEFTGLLLLRESATPGMTGPGNP